MLNRKLALEEESALFILVNFADVILTGLAFGYGAQEVNIFAKLILVRLGLTGLVVYKFALVTLVLLVCQYIHRTHPKTARAILIIGSAAYGVLVVGVTITLFVHELRLG